MTDQLIALAVAAIWAIGIVVTSRRISQAERRALDALERAPASSLEEALRRHLEERTVKFAALSRNDLVAIAIGALIGVAADIALVAAGVESPLLRAMLTVVIGAPVSAILVTAYLALVHRMRHR